MTLAPDEPDTNFDQMCQGGIINGCQLAGEATLETGYSAGQRGSVSRTRTYDRAINSRLLYQLSYHGIAEGAGIADIDRGSSPIVPPSGEFSALSVLREGHKKRRETSSRQRRWVMVGVSKEDKVTIARIG